MELDGGWCSHPIEIFLRWCCDKSTEAVYIAALGLSIINEI